MSYRELIILLPCHSLEDFPVHHEGDEAAGLLAGWSALWHPQLIASAQSILTWRRMDDPPEELEERLLVIPPVSEQDLSTGFIARARDSGAVVIEGTTDRPTMVATALEKLGPQPGLDEDLAADFLALGYCHLQVELLTRQMRYASNLDEIHFQNLAVAAANAAVEGELDRARQKITACFDLLAEERDHYYSVDAYLLDLTMVASSTLGTLLQQELSSEVPINLLICGELVEQMGRQYPQSLELFKQGIKAGRVGLIGGPGAERAWPLMPLEALLADLEQGGEIYQQQLGSCATVFGRRRHGLTPVLPQLLVKSGFAGAFHLTLEDGTFPEGSQVKTRWEGTDSTSIDSISKVPLDANKPETFLSLANRLGESMDMDHVATLCLAHWPGQVSPWYDDLRRISRYTSALGRFVTVEKYFEETDLPGLNDRFEADQYASPYLKQAIIRGQGDVISHAVTYWRCWSRWQQLESLTFLATVLGQTAENYDSLYQQLLEAGLFCEPANDKAAENEQPAALTGLYSELAEAIDSQLAVISAGIPRSDQAPRKGYLLVNPLSFVRRVECRMDELDQSPALRPPIYASAELHQEGQTERHVIVDVPSMGFSWVESEEGAVPTSPGQPMAEENMLRNDFFQVIINPKTGGIQSIGEYGSRGNRLSQQLAFREPGRRKQGEPWVSADELANYSSMVAESIEITGLTETMGEITSRGKLLDLDNKPLADFRQRMRLQRGSRVLEIEIELDLHREPSGDPWNSYFSSRFAWADEGADVYRGVNQTRHRATAPRLESVDYFEIHEDDWRTSILTGGLPFHRRVGYRMLDSLLVVRGESCRTFKLGIGVDLVQPLSESMSWMADIPHRCENAAPPQGNATSWLFHLNARNVVATSWRPLVEEGQCVGLVVRLLETAGRPGKVTLSAFRPLLQAEQRDFKAGSLGACRLDDGKVVVEMAAAEWLEVEARWDAPAAGQEPAEKSEQEFPADSGIVVTIDGPAGAGKSSVAMELARTLGFQFLDTGAMYRAVAYLALQGDISWQDETGLGELAKELQLEFQDGAVIVDGKDVSEAVRQPEVTQNIHHVADNLKVRESLVLLQRRLAKSGNVVTEGRDQGTVAFPEAECKIFLTASAEERARRRHLQLQDQGVEETLEEVLRQLQDRDERDSQRPVGALQAAEDAIVVETDGMNEVEVVEYLTQLVRDAASGDSS